MCFRNQSFQPLSDKIESFSLENGYNVKCPQCTGISYRTYIEFATKNSNYKECIGITFLKR